MSDDYTPWWRSARVAEARERVAREVRLYGPITPASPEEGKD